jgi:hypothetical protein
MGYHRKKHGAATTEHVPVRIADLTRVYETGLSQAAEFETMKREVEAWLTRTRFGQAAFRRAVRFILVRVKEISRYCGIRSGAQELVPGGVPTSAAQAVPERTRSGPKPRSRSQLSYRGRFKTI